MMNPLHADWNAPKRQAQFKPKMEGDWFKTLKYIGSKSGTGFFIGICGTRGGGKTQLGVELMKLATHRKQAAYYITAAEFFLKLQATMRRDSPISAHDLICGLRAPKLLIFDEIGKRGETAWENNVLFDLFNKR